MNRHRASALGRFRPDGRWSHPILLAVLLTALAACGEATPTAQPSTSDQPSALESTGPTDAAPTTPASELPSASPGSSDDGSTPEPSAGSGRPTNSGSVADCSGSDENRDFYASMAAAVDWTVYCAVLPDGWFVDDGQYRLAGGGWMEIGYNGPGNARIMLREGAFCRDVSGCVAAGREVGETAFGDRIGALVAGNDGSWSIVVGRGATPSWLLEVSGLDEAGSRKIAADLRAIAR